MNDVHYYLSKIDLPISAVIWVSGMNFTPYEGKYSLPFSEGNLDVRVIHDGELH